MKNVHKKVSVGLLFVAAALFLTVSLVYLLEEQLSPEFQICFQIALYAFGLFILLNIVPFCKSLKKRHVRESIGLLILVPIIFGMLSFLYLIADAKRMRFDHTVSKKFTLSAQTIKILQSLNDSIEIICFYKDGQPGKASLEAGLEQYAFHTDKLAYSFFDPDKYPQKAKEFAIEEYGEVIVRSSLGHERIKNVVSEEQITNAILKVTSDKKKTIYFLTGHGESSIEGMDRTGFGLLRKQLEINNYEVKELELMRTPEMPTDISCLVASIAKTDYFDEELQKIREFVLLKGGSLLITVDTDAPTTMKELAKSFGVRVGDDMIIDKMSQLFGANYETVVISQYGKHPITESFNVASFFPSSSSVIVSDEAAEMSWEALAIAFSGAGSWAEEDLKRLKSKGEATLEQGEKQGPISVGVALKKEISLIDSESNELKKKKAKVVIYGDTDFMRNAYLKLSGNRDFILNTLAWLSGDENLISIRPKQVDATPLYLRKGQTRMLFVIPVIVFPAVFLAMGIGVFVSRRRK